MVIRPVVLVLPFLFLLSLSCTHSTRVVGEEPERTSREWGEVVAGLRASISSEKRVYTVGEEVVVSVSIQNFSDRAVYPLCHSYYVARRPFWYEPYLRTSNGQVLQAPIDETRELCYLITQGYGATGCLLPEYRLLPGETYSEILKYVFTEPLPVGTRFFLVAEFRTREGTDWPNNRDLQVYELRTNEIQLHVPYDIVLRK